MSHTTWTFEGEVFTVGEDLTTKSPDNVAIKNSYKVVYFKKNTYLLLGIKHARREIRACILDIYNPGKPYWTKAKNVFWVTKQ